MDAIIDFFKQIGSNKIILWLEEILLFYIKPITFYRRYFKKDTKEKLFQLFFYFFCVVLFGYILIEDIALRKLAKAATINLLSTFIVCIVLLCTKFTINKIRKVAITSLDIVLFVIIAKLLFAPFAYLSYGLFLYTENYNFFFIYNLLEAILVVYAYFLSNRVFYIKISLILIGSTTNIIFLNGILILLSLLSLDNYTLDLSDYVVHDKIIEEYTEATSKLIPIEKFPSFIILYQTPNNETIYKGFLFSNFYDSLSTGSKTETFDFNNALSSNIQKIDTLVNTMRFNRNKEILASYKSYLVSINKILLDTSNEKYTTEPIYKQVIIVDSPKAIIAKKSFIPLKISYHDSLFAILSKQNELMYVSINSQVPTAITSYFIYPYLKYTSQVDTTLIR